MIQPLRGATVTEDPVYFGSGVAANLPVCENGLMATCSCPQLSILSLRN